MTTLRCSWRPPNESANRQTFLRELLLVGLASVFVVGRFSSGDTSLTQKPIRPEAEAELQNAMRKACERMERGKVLTGVLAALRDEPREA